ncbi:uncharacterized protein F5147DRAFT_831827 [Suillus discolor]|uniref:Uncharacterized protein n=1 Tax=Suillus discolor TaxID=1912936 RepID=A0A9P7FJD3_9AGAM|nr:uncharacterized protein F5147DRAFT_831827 [Suillus discolor]KAG2120570.1 hypothetical protein F5147DRAFT_831827 [Suillus discolor]
MYKRSLGDRLRACLLSPNLTAYVTDLSAKIFDFSKKNPSVFKISVEALQDSDAMDRLDVLMKKILTAQRGNMKQKLIASIEKRSDLSTLARSLAGNCTELTMAHWARIAFMRSFLIDFRTLCSHQKTTNAQLEEASTGPSLQPQTDEGGDNNIPIGTTASASHELGEDGEDDNDNEEERTWSFSQYWEYLDKVLDELKEEARQKHAFPQARADYIKQFFTKCLQQDLQIFPGGGSLAPSLDSVTYDTYDTNKSERAQEDLIPLGYNFTRPVYLQIITAWQLKITDEDIIAQTFLVSVLQRHFVLKLRDNIPLLFNTST